MAGFDGTFTMRDAPRHVGRELAVSDWLDLDQHMVTAFGELTRHYHWLHLDPERAAAESAYGGTLVQGLLMLSLVVHFNDACGLRPADSAHALNYGFDRVRFIEPVALTPGARIRDRIALTAVEPREAGRMLFKTAHVIEAEGHDRPAVTADWLTLWVPKPDG
jgi:acyl dehydratase